MFGVLEGQIILGFRGTNPGVILGGGSRFQKSRECHDPQSKIIIFLNALIGIIMLQLYRAKRGNQVY